MTISRRTFLRMSAGAAAMALVSGPAGEAWSFGESSDFRFGQLQYPGSGWNARRGAIERLLLELELSTSILVADEAPVIDATSDDLGDVPAIFVGGDRGFEPWSEELRSSLRRYLSAGGMLIFDSSEDRIDGDFYASSARELQALLPASSLAQLSREHVLLKSFYLCNGDEGRVATASYLEGVEENDRLRAIYCHNDLMGAWARDQFGNYEYSVYPTASDRRERAFRLGVNIAMYALCLDYKADQVHVPHIMRRRRWRVD